MTKTPYYLTTAIAYTSGKPHIGNCYDPLVADVIARFKRLQGFLVRYQTGTDEHGQKNENKAKEKGVTPKAYVDGVAAEIKKLWDDINTSYDYFIRTTDEYHETQVKKICKKLFDQGDIYKGEYEGHYCSPCESFWTKSQLVDGKCPDCMREVTLAKEEAYFFKMSKYADRLIDYINNNDFIYPTSRKNEMMNNFLLPGLQDLCVSRTSFTWGVKLDFDPKHVVYVWLDALVNYITGIGYDADGNHSEDFLKFWPADVHIIGKDIVRFHTIYWPIFLMALDLPLPKKVFGHPWLLTGEVKMSKSRGNVIYADDVANIFGLDALRFYCLSEMPFDQDGNFTFELFAERYNSELANVLGNLVNRTAAMANKYFDGLLEDKGVFDNDYDLDFGHNVSSVFALVRDRIDSFHIADALSAIFDLFKRCNKYIDESEPWKLAKDPTMSDRLSTVLFKLSEGILTGACLLSPFMPDTAEKIVDNLGARLDFNSIENNLGLSGSIRVSKTPVILFERIDIKTLEDRIGEYYK